MAEKGIDEQHFVFVSNINLQSVGYGRGERTREKWANQVTLTSSGQLDSTA